jgi:hypothetical protein
MLIVEPSSGTFPSVIDSTIRAEYVNCQTKFYWSFIRQLGPRGGSVDLIAGGAFAKGLEVVRKAHWAEGKPFATALSQGMAAAIAEWGSFICPDHKQQKNIDRVVQALDFYFQRWPIASDPIKPYYWSPGNPAVEFTFAIPLPIDHPTTGEPLIYGGRNDLVGIYNDQIFIVDEKTASQLGPTWGQKWNLRSQFTGYVWAARNTGLPVAGAIVRGISFLKNSFGAAESIQFRPQWQVDRWYEQLLADVEAMVSSYRRGVYNQVLADACEAYYGCPFMRLCESEHPEGWVGEYAKREWNPLSKYPTGKPVEKEAEIVPLGFSLEGR